MYTTKGQVYVSYLDYHDKEELVLYSDDPPKLEAVNAG